MIIAILADISKDMARQIEDAVGDLATVLDTPSAESAVELLQSVPAELVIFEMPRLTDDKLSDLQRLKEQSDDAVIICVAPDEVIERTRQEGIEHPDLWLRADCGEDDRQELLAGALETAKLRSETDSLSANGSPGPDVVHSAERKTGDLDAFNRLMSGLTSGFDLDRLLEALVDAVSQFSRCAGYALLWEAEDASLRVRCHQGMRAEVVAGARLRPKDALSTWYRRNRRVLTSSELSQWEDRRKAVQVRRELELFGGQIALPMMVRGRLAGILILGEKVLGESYSSGEIETLFNVTNHVALAAQSIELHEELSCSKAYTDSIVESMGAGLITLGPDERIAVCNPYAAEVLGIDRAEVEGSDLRALPSPLGDLLYSALISTDGNVAAKEVSIRGGGTALRVSTSIVRDADGRTLGSVLMLDDVTTERELAQERSRRERLDVVNRIVGRIAHEVKNPLTAVKTYAELMSANRGGEQLDGFWSNTVIPEIARLDEMLKNLLRMVEQPEAQPELSCIQTLLAKAVEAVPIADEIKQQAFDVRFEDSVTPVMVDPIPTRDALSYLLEYLADTRPYPVLVEVKVSDEEPATVSVKMTRLTTANGAFNPETVLDAIHAMQDPDCALGPAISQKIIDNQNGRLRASIDDGRVSMLVSLPTSHTETGDREVPRVECQDTGC